MPTQAALITQWDDVQAQYDAVVVGAGAGGGVAACVLAEAGHRVLLVERGPWLGTHDLRHDHLRSARLSFGYETPSGPPQYSQLVMAPCVISPNPSVTTAR